LEEDGLAKMKHTVEPIIGELREAEVVLAQGQTVGEVCRSLGMAEQSFETNCSIARSSIASRKPRS
jgi:hypothetical protein